MGYDSAAVVVALLAILHSSNLLFPTEPAPSDTEVAALSGRFAAAVEMDDGESLCRCARAILPCVFMRRSSPAAQLDQYVQCWTG